jgi:hypothetical protein
MAGLSKLILPSSALDADDVVENFNALKDVVNDLKDHNFEPGALNTRHFLEEALSSPTLPFKKTYRNTFTATAIPKLAYGEMVRLVTAGTGSPPETHREDSIVFVIAELEVYEDKAKAVPIEVMGNSNNDTYGLRLECSQGVGTGTSWSSFANETQRYVTPGSSEAGVYAEIFEVVLFGLFPVVNTSANFEARVMAKSFGEDGSGNYDLTVNGSDDGKVEGSITALVIAR